MDAPSAYWWKDLSLHRVNRLQMATVSNCLLVRWIALLSIKGGPFMNSEGSAQVYDEPASIREHEWCSSSVRNELMRNLQCHQYVFWKCSKDYNCSEMAGVTESTQRGHSGDDILLVTAFKWLLRSKSKMPELNLWGFNSEWLKKKKTAFILTLQSSLSGALCLCSSMASHSVALPLQWISDDMGSMV